MKQLISMCILDQTFLLRQRLSLLRILVERALYLSIRETDYYERKDSNI